jgi:hypothetical protein
MRAWLDEGAIRPIQCFERRRLRSFRRHGNGGDRLALATTAWVGEIRWESASQNDCPVSMTVVAGGLFLASRSCPMLTTTHVGQVLGYRIDALTKYTKSKMMKTGHVIFIFIRERKLVYDAPLGTVSLFWFAERC